MTPAFTLVPTADGSYTFFSDEFGEWFHSREGAYTEARQTYAAVTQLAVRSQAPSLSLLDVCYGLGYNTAAALDTIWQVNPDCQVTLRALEINPEVFKSAIAHNLMDVWSKPVQAVMMALAQEHTCNHPQIDAQLLIGDARQTIQPLVATGWQADAIFLDPFSPPKCPELWTVEFLQLVAHCLKPSGCLATYSCSAAVRRALQLAGLTIGSTLAAGRRWPGTVASHHSSQSLPNALSDYLPLSQQELEHLQTRAAVPYQDQTLQATATEIQQQRQQAQLTCSLEPTGQWRRRWLFLP